MRSDNDRGEHEFRFPADLRSGEDLDGRDKPRRERRGGRSLGLHGSPRRMAAELTTSLADPKKRGSRDDRNDRASYPRVR